MKNPKKKKNSEKWGIIPLTPQNMRTLNGIIKASGQPPTQALKRHVLQECVLRFTEEWDDLKILLSRASVLVSEYRDNRNWPFGTLDAEKISRLLKIEDDWRRDPEAVNEVLRIISERRFPREMIEMAVNAYKNGF
jgi:hypothetical protein